MGTDRRTSRTANSAKSSPTASTTRCARISRGSRKSELTGVFVITGVSECAVNTRRRPDDAAVLLVSPRGREANFARRNDGKQSSNIFSTSFLVTDLFSASLVYDYINVNIFYVRNQALVPPSSFYY